MTDAIDPRRRSSTADLHPTNATSNQGVAAAQQRSPDAALEHVRAFEIDHALLASLMRAGTIERSLDATRDAYSGPYRVGGQAVVAQPQFRMSGGYEGSHGIVIQRSSANETAADQSSPEAFMKSLTPKGQELVHLLARAGIRNPGSVMLGYGAPAELVKATQALIDAGKLPKLAAPATTADCIRKMQWDWGVGVDCVDWCMHSLTRATGRTFDSLGLKAGTDPFGDDAKNIAPAHFQSVDVRTANAGDIVKLYDPTSPPGHRVIVRDHLVLGGASDPTRGDLAKWGGDSAKSFLQGAGPFHVYKVDSSWGAEDGKNFGGYRRDTWVLDDNSKQWMSFDPHTNAILVSRSGPAGELLAGTYRVKP